MSSTSAGQPPAARTDARPGTAASASGRASQLREGIRAGRRRSAGRRAWARRLLSALTLTAGLLTVARFADVLGPVPMAQALYPLAGVAAVAAMLAWAARREWAGVALAAPAAVTALALAGPALRADTVPAGPDDVVVMALNLRFGRADPAAVVEQVRARRPDLLILSELTTESMASMRALGLDGFLPHTTGAGGGALADETVLLSRVALAPIPDARSRAVSPSAGSARLGGRDVAVHAVHTAPPPLPPYWAPTWRADLRALGAWVARQPAQKPLILAGDFNASRAHPAFRWATAGLVDARAATGAGWVRTWPMDAPSPPFVQIDHIMVRHLAVVDSGEVTIAGTDHAMVWARLRVASPDGQPT